LRYQVKVRCGLQKLHGTVRHENVGAAGVEAVDVFAVVTVDHAGAWKIVDRRRRRDGRVDAGDVDEIGRLRPAADARTPSGRLRRMIGGDPLAQLPCLRAARILGEHHRVGGAVADFDHAPVNVLPEYAAQGVRVGQGGKGDGQGRVGGDRAGRRVV